jgi:L-threonylcarbamoyladenylate synthase
MRGAEAVARAVAAVREGEPVVIPTDTVYGLACDPHREDAVRRLSELKRRSPEQPIALVAATVETLLELLPGLDGRSTTLVRSLLPGGFTLVLPNPARRFPWLAGARPETLGVRVPDLSGVAAAFFSQVAAVAATSANLHGGPDPRRLADVPEEIRAGVAALLDAGELPGAPSTVVDLTQAEPQVLREGAVSREETLARVRAVLRE